MISMVLEEICGSIRIFGKKCSRGRSWASVIRKIEKGEFYQGDGLSQPPGVEPAA
jgi:hypothetical protein